MDFLSIRRKARERAEAQARREAAAAPPSRPAEPEAAPPSPPPAPAIEQVLRAEGSRPVPAGPASAEPVPPEPVPPEAEPPRTVPPQAALPQAVPPRAATALPPGEPEDPLAAFFWREDEEAPPIPDLGGGASGAGSGQRPDQALREYVTFLLAGEEYGLAIGRVREIVRPPPIAEVPRAPEHVAGVVTLRGEVVPVFDPRRRLSLPPQAPGSRARIVVCDSARGPAGLLVDAVSHVLRLPPTAVEPRPPGIGGAGTEAITGIGREGERLVVLLDLDLLLGTAAPPPAEAP